MSVAKVIELTASSPKSFEDAWRIEVGRVSLERIAVLLGPCAVAVTPQVQRAHVVINP